MTVPSARPSKLQLPKSICGVFRGMLGAVPLAHDGCPEIIPCGDGAVQVSHPATLTKSSIAAGGGEREMERKTLLHGR